MKSANLETHLRSVHKTKLKAKPRIGTSAKGNAEETKVKAPKPSSVTFPWKWLGVGAAILLIVLAVIIVRPGLSPGTPPGDNNVPPECIQGRDIISRFTFTLHVLKTNSPAHPINYTTPITHIIPYDIGKEPKNGQDCTREMYSGSLGEYVNNQTAAVIHVESPRAGPFYLGEFFNIWSQPLNYSRGEIISYLKDNWTIVMKVNGNDSTEIWERLPVTAGMKVEFYVTWYQ